MGAAIVTAVSLNAASATFKIIQASGQIRALEADEEKRQAALNREKAVQGRGLDLRMRVRRNELISLLGTSAQAFASGGIIGGQSVVTAQTSLAAGEAFASFRDEIETRDRMDIITLRKRSLKDATEAAKSQIRIQTALSIFDTAVSLGGSIAAQSEIAKGQQAISDIRLERQATQSGAVATAAAFG